MERVSLPLHDFVEMELARCKPLLSRRVSPLRTVPALHHTQGLLMGATSPGALGA
jgi:hypothetical protein